MQKPWAGVSGLVLWRTRIVVRPASTRGLFNLMLDFTVADPIVLTIESARYDFGPAGPGATIRSRYAKYRRLRDLSNQADSLD